MLVAASPLSEADHGRYVVELDAADLAGNSSGIAAVDCEGDCFAVDAIAPTATLDDVFREGASAADARRGVIGVTPGYDTVVIDLTLSRDHADEEVSYAVTFGGAPVSEGCSEAAAPDSYRCRHVVTPDEPAGTRAIVVTLEDTAGNRGSAEDGVVIDAVGPKALGFAQLQRDDGNARAQVALDHLLLNRQSLLDPNGSPPSAVVTVYLSEALDTGVPPTVVLRRAGEVDRPWTLLSDWDSDAAFVVARYEPLGDEAEGDASVVVTAQDRFGNESEHEIGTVTFDHTARTLSAAFLREHVLHVRRPWGEAGDPHERYEVLVDDVVEPEATVRVFDGVLPATARLLGEANADDAGVVPPIRLADVDAEDVWVHVRDRAGNGLETLQRVHKQRWIASLGPVSPHTAEGATRVAGHARRAVRPYTVPVDQGLLALGEQTSRRRSR